MEPNAFRCVLKDSSSGRLLSCLEKQVDQTLTATRHQIPAWYSLLSDNKALSASISTTACALKGYQITALLYGYVLS